MILLSHTNINHAIEKGLYYLHQAQRPSGEFTTYTSPNLDLSEGVLYAKSVYVTTFVMHALATLPSSSSAAPLIKEMQERAASFLEQEQEDNGAWNYEGRGQQRIPSDLDDTSCAIAALAEFDRQPELSFYALLWQNESAPGGPYYTWLGINDREDDPRARQIDALVNANILFCCGLLNLSLPGTIYYLEQVIHAEAYQSESAYIISPYFLLYALSRAYADGQVTALEPAMSTMTDYILSKLPPPRPDAPTFHIACLAAALLNLSVPSILIRPYLAPLLATQRPDGSWPGWGAYAGFSPNYDGSPDLTTALTIEALGKYIKA